MSKTLSINSIPSSVAIFGSKALNILYRDYCATLAKESPDEQPMLAKDFEAIVTTARAERQEHDKVTCSPQDKSALESKGWKFTMHTPVKGSQKGKAGMYLVNDEASVSGGGFLRVNRTTLERTKAQMLKNVEAIDILLASK